VLVDAHVHFYPSYDRDRFLAAALANFRRGAAELGLPAATPGILLLSEGHGERWFLRLRDEAANESAGDWHVEPCAADPAALVAWRRDLPDDRLFLVAGRQIATREGIEVLALTTAAELADGLPLFDTLDWAREQGAIAVLPWGFGKWSFQRGRLVLQALSRFDRAPLFLGDSAARPQLAPRPRLFDAAEKRHIPILPGTDPLPFPSQMTLAGSYGFALAGPFREDRPVQSLRCLLNNDLRQPRRYGRRAGLLGFAVAQAAMQARKHAQRGL